ncbi:MAG: hypothetical protein IKE34_12155 [Paenibacillus sp.]|uniref:Signal transducing protein n=1 Tax=Paenibacillus aquistagni TaxID=1852522 RepID=A0A1X7IDD0_9BACL|nr:hypothetical protein [Paenibacillus aquistagni]MBR2569921.1 hypothetical protein [Paenibacillus sp.]NMM51533.1 hypothetical protein [Paenibacillus aquistagni]SMG12269.1 hypothetical protein SAMN06295960_0321 [Paenibacillus aquistagni]
MMNQLNVQFQHDVEARLFEMKLQALRIDGVRVIDSTLPGLAAYVVQADVPMELMPQIEAVVQDHHGLY